MQPHDFDRIFKMQKVNQTESSQDIEMRETQAVSPDSMVREEASSKPVLFQKGLKCYWKQCTFLAMLLLCSLMLGYEINASEVNIQGVQAGSIPSPQELENDFMAFCPATDAEVGGFSGDELRRRLFSGGASFTANLEKANQDYLHNKTYIISAKSVLIGSTKSLRYCGRARRLTQTCAESHPDLCLAKPMFDTLTFQEIDIIWVNALDPAYVPTVSGCIDTNTSSSEFCSLHVRLLDKTFSDPTVVNDTHLSSSAEMMRISKDNWPMSTHVHGAEIRPTFDGNPLSWVSNNREKKNGLGAFSMKDEWYYSKFEQSIDDKTKQTKLLPPRFILKDASGEEVHNFKVNRYPNKQNPGTLWFHDHSMRLTGYNVGAGLSGFYLLRDPQVEDIMKGLNAKERFVMLDALNVTGLTDLDADTVYRFRFLNANYQRANTVKYSFGYGGCGSTGPLGPIIKFSVIGADSSLFRNSLDDQQSFAISNGERVELLIVFPASPDFNTLSICGSTIVQAKSGEHSMDSSMPTSGPGSSYSINNIKLNKKSRDNKFFTPKSIKNLQFKSVAYVNLTEAVYADKVAVQRSRPLIKAATKFTINGRADFHSGKSENPKIGDIEDWLIVNTYTGTPHPIHVHLINFQVVRQYNLRMFSDNCPLYALDFYAAAIKYGGSPDRKTHYPDVDELYNQVFGQGILGYPNYNVICEKIKTIENMVNLEEALAAIYPEDAAGKANGQDVFKICGVQEIEILALYGQTCVDSGLYYITNPRGEPHSRSFYSQWKDTAFVEPKKVFQYRIRWTKSHFDQTKVKGNSFNAMRDYFNVPADQLREYPGFVYHCHILFHEDNEMMRPIMLQLPPGLTPNSTCPQVVWNEKAACINGPNIH